jgi:peptidoglycan biosynthesis protein MviN/MurJ (putative lipid II flippase)
MLWVASLVLLARSAGALRDIVIAHRFGTGPIVDGFALVSGMATWAAGLWLTLLQSIAVPIRARLNSGEGARFDDEMLSISILIGLVIVVIFVATMPALLRAFVPEHAPATLTFAERFTVALAPLAGLSFIVAAINAQLLTRRSQAYTVLEGVPALVLVVVLYVATAPGLEALVVGALLGATAHIACLLVLRRRQLGQFKFRLPASGDAWRAFVAGFGVLAFSQLVFSVSTPADQLFAARLGEGQVASLAYSSRVLAIVTGLAALAIVRTFLPHFAALVAAGHESAGSALRWSMALFVIGAVAVAMVWTVVPLAIHLLFERGAFTSGDTEAVATLVRWSLLQVPCYCAALVLIQQLLATQRLLPVALVSLVTAPVKVVGAYLLSNEYGTVGIVWSTVVMYLLSFLMLFAIQVAPRRDSS